MGLYGEFSHTYPTWITVNTEWCNASQSVDYSDVTQNALTEFLNTAQGLCPIRTGFLISTISGSSSGDGFIAEATADYAEYVEYGTWKMDAQPYFVEPFQTAGEECGESIQIQLDIVLAEVQAMARLAIDEHYTMEREDAYADFRAQMAGGVSHSQFASIYNELEQKLHELALKYVGCVEQVETQIEDYRGQGTFEIFIE